MNSDSDVGFVSGFDAPVSQCTDICGGFQWRNAQDARLLRWPDWYCRL